MIKIGDFWVNIGSYTDLTKLFLGEASKYLLLFLFSVLAIRLWRKLSGLSGKNRQSYLSMACLATAIALVIGYFSIYSSLSRLYFIMGRRLLIPAILGRHASFLINLQSIG